MQTHGNIAGRRLSGVVSPSRATGLEYLGSGKVIDVKSIALRRIGAVFALLVLALASLGSWRADDALAAPEVRPLPPVTASDDHFGAVEAFRTNQTSVAYDAGVKWERLTFWWSGMQAGPGQDLNPFYMPFNYIDQERQRGIKVVGLLINTPDWAAADPSQHTASVPKDLALPYDDPNNYWGQYVAKVVKMYQGRIDDWIIWNEPDIQAGDPNAAYRTWAGSPADYYQLLKVAYQAAHGANPNARVLTAGVTYWTDIKEGRRQYFDRFLDQVAADPTAAAHNRYFDAVSLHLYINPDGLYKVPVYFHQLMQGRGFDKPLWINETNVIPYDDPVNAGTDRATPRDLRASLDEQASFILEGYAMGLAAGVDRISVYKMKDGDGDVVNGQALVSASYQPRPAYVAYQLAASYYSRASSATLYSSKELREVIFDEGSRRVTAVWTTKPVALSVSVPASGSSAEVIDQYGRSRSVSPSNSQYALTLDPATMHTNQDDPNAYLIGGHPLLLVEQGTTGVATKPIVGTYGDLEDVNDGRPLGGPAPASAVPALALAGAADNAPGATCQYVLGFKALHQLDAADVGGCLENQAFAANGDAQQRSTNGLLVWRKADNWTAFTNGYQTWINGPRGLAKRLNTQRFGWEANPTGLPVVNG